MIRYPFFLLVLMLFCVTGCASKANPTYAPITNSTLRIAVLDGRMAAGKEETRKTIVGSGFSSRSRYESGTANLILADIIAEDLQRLPGVLVKSRLDLRAYMADKERLLARKYPALKPEDRRLLLAEQSPVDYGRSIGVDYVVYPTVEKARLTQNRMLQSWMSSVQCKIELYDVQSGELVWTWRGGGWRCFSSVYRVMQSIAEDFSEHVDDTDAFGVKKQTRSE